MSIDRPSLCFRVVLTIVMVVAVSGTWMAAQATTGSLTGTVRAPDGSALPGATATVTSPVLQGPRITSSDVSGTFVLRQLPPGTYELTIALPGFASAQRTIVVGIGQQPDVSVALAATSSVGTITVTNEIAELNDTSVLSAEIDALPLPLERRSPFTSVPELIAPGVQFGASPNQIRISGGFPFDNLLLLDGVDAADNLFGDNRTLFIEDAVQETQVLTGGISAQYGRFTGGVVNAITKSGGNDLSGSFRMDVTNRNWSASTPQDRPVDSGGTDVRTYQGTLGGYIVRDRLWFFAAGRQGSTEEHRELAVTGIPFTPSSDGFRYEGKLTARFAPRHNLAGSYLRSTTDEVLGRDNGATPSTVLSPTTKGQLFVANYTGVLTRDLFAEAQYSGRKFSFENAGGTSTDPQNAPYFTLDSAVNVFNPVLNGLARNERNNRQFAASLSYFRGTSGFGTHDVRVGYDGFQNTRIESAARSSTGVTFFTNYQTDQGRIVLDSSNRPTPIWTPNSTFIFVNPILTPATVEATTNSFYLMDRWKIRDNITLNLGIRYEHSSLEGNGTAVASSNSVAPRMGVAWSPSVKGGFLAKIFGGYSRYGGRYDLKQLSDGLFGDQGHFRLYTGASGTGLSFAPAFDFVKNYGAAFPVDQAAMTSVDPATGAPFVDEFIAGTEFQVLQDLRVGLSFVHRNYGQVIEDLSPNGPATVVTSGGGTAQADSTLVTNSQGAVRKYDALDVHLDKRFSKRWSFNLGYTYSKLFGNYLGETATGTPDTSAAGDYPAIFNAARHFPETDIAGPHQNQLRVRTIYTIPTGSGSVDIGAVLRADSGGTFLFQSTVPLTSIQKALAAGAGNLNPPTTQTISFNNEVGQFEGETRFDVSATYTRPFAGGPSLWLKADLLNVFNTQAKLSFDTTITPAGPNDALGLPTTYTRAATFGNATSRQAFTLPRTFGLSAGVRF